MTLVRAMVTGAACGLLLVSLATANHAAADQWKDTKVRAGIACDHGRVVGLILQIDEPGVYRIDLTKECLTAI